jgi:hypothetical protein
MARKKATTTKRPTRLPQQRRRQVESYEHKDKQRVNNPPVGLVTPETDPDAGAKDLQAEIDQERIKTYRGTVSLPFEPGEHKRIAVKIVDDRGIESLKVMGVGE